MEETSIKHNGYKYCIVPDCKSTSVKTPNKVFITLPGDPKINKQWQAAMKRKTMLSIKSRFFVCEDHFNLETDMENYVKFKLMNNVRIKMKPGVVPHIFDCQKNPTTTYSSEKYHGTLLRKQRLTIDEALKLEQPNISKKSRRDDAKKNRFAKKSDRSHRSTQTTVAQRDRRTQANIRPKKLSRSTQCCL